MKLRNTRISIPAAGAWLDGLLSHAPDVRGLVIVLQPHTVDAPGPCDARTGSALRDAGYATLMLDLLTEHESLRDPDAPYNVPQMANRIIAVAEWIDHQPPLASLPLGIIASETNSGAAVRAAWKAPGRFAALVCRGGRADLAGATPLASLSTPIRVVVGGEDPGLHRVEQAFALIGAPKDWQQIPGEGESFVEPEALDAFARLALDWVARNMPPPAPASAAAQADQATSEPAGAPADGRSVVSGDHEPDDAADTPVAGR